MQFEYLEPKTIEEAVSVIEESGGKAKVIAGGTDLLLQIRDGRISPEFVVDLAGIDGLNYIAFHEGTGVSIGALTPISTVEKSDVLREKIPILAQAAGQLGSVGIRNLGTIGGNLCNAAPSAETAPSLLALGAEAKIAGPQGERTVPMEAFFTGPGTTVLGQGEILVEIRIPLPAPGTRGMYLKHGLRGTIDLAVVGVAAVLTLEADGQTCRDARIALGAVAPTPVRAPSAEDMLKGKKMDMALIERCAKAAVGDTSCISDVRASAEYRREMVEVFTRRALKGLID